MASDYLLKTEASAYSFEDLVRDKVTVWDGVTNPAAVKNLREMQPGTRLVIYETGDWKVQWARLRWFPWTLPILRTPAVKIKVGKALGKPVIFSAEIKAHKLFADSPLVRQGPARQWCR